MKKIAFASCLFIISHSFAQTYKATWESLDARPVPQWYKDAKFGIFIHWGVYSVPGWGPKGSYSEWYQNGLESGDSARIKFHKAKFGDRTYYSLADDFKAELFDPAEWAHLFERSGAKYIVLTSKHHDGFTLWPDKETNNTWGFSWNAVDIGPRRDLLGDLFKAVRNTSVHPGMYYSLYEWFNPLWKLDKNKYAISHAWPQMKDLITNYQPDVFWTDGDWEASDETWRSKEFLQWIYNESPVKDKVVTYDRWGSGIRFKHGGVFTPEYQPDIDFEDHYWEESRGMGKSYGYNRGEDAWDYNTAQSLIIALIDKVSRGGNFLLDIGPDEHGKIPPIMEERLLQIGEWLTTNGESIYGTSRWKIPFQWSDGIIGYKPKNNEDPMLKLTVNPDPGYAVKNIFFSYNSNTNSFYAIFPKYPDDKRLLLKGFHSESGLKISFLSTGENLSYQQEGENLSIRLPDYNPNKIKSTEAYVVKISNYGAFSKRPEIKVTYNSILLNPEIQIIAKGPGIIRYTNDGNEPNETSTEYIKRFINIAPAIIKAKTFQTGFLPSNTATISLVKYNWNDAVKINGLKPGIEYKYFEPVKNISLKSVEFEPVVKSGITNEISLLSKMRKEKFALQFDGYINIAISCFYTFFTQSDDGSKLFIDDIEVVDNDGDHGNVEKSGRAALKKGFHKIKVVYFDSGGDNDLKVLFQPEGGMKEVLSVANLYH